jgi:hypothetical protein
VSTSLDELCEATEFNRLSLYAAFGDKRAVPRNPGPLRRSRGRMRDGRACAPTPRSDTRFHTDMIEQIVAGPGRTRCFLGNCAADLARHDQVAAGRRSKT